MQSVGPLVVTGSPPVREGNPGVWVCTAVASTSWQQSEELVACSQAGFNFCNQDPWQLMGSGGLELAEGCLLRPFGSHCVVFLRNNTFMQSRSWETSVQEKLVPGSVEQGLLGSHTDSEELASRELVAHVRRVAGDIMACGHEYEGKFEGYAYTSHLLLSKYAKARAGVDGKMKEMEDMRTKIRVEWSMERRLQKEQESWFGDWRQGGEREWEIEVRVHRIPPFAFEHGRDCNCSSSCNALASQRCFEAGLGLHLI